MGQLDYVIVRTVRGSGFNGNGCKTGELAYKMAHIPLKPRIDYLEDWKLQEKKKAQDVLTQLAKTI